METKHRYSRKVRLFGYCIIVFELLIIAVWIAASYGNGMALFSIAQSSFNNGRGSAIGFVNTTAGETLTLPITGGGFFPTTVSAGMTILDSQNRTLSQIQSSVTVSPGQTQDLALTVPSSIVAMAKTGTFYLHISFEVSSIYGLVGLGSKVDLNTCSFSGGCNK